MEDYYQCPICHHATKFHIKISKPESTDSNTALWLECSVCDHQIFATTEDI